MTRKTYKVTDVEYNAKMETLRWIYAGKSYMATGEFYIDRKGYLFHSFFTPRGAEKLIKIKVF